MGTILLTDHQQRKEQRRQEIINSYLEAVSQGASLTKWRELIAKRYFVSPSTISNYVRRYKNQSV